MDRGGFRDGDPGPWESDLDVTGPRDCHRGTRHSDRALSCPPARFLLAAAIEFSVHKSCTCGPIVVATCPRSDTRTDHLTADTDGGSGGQCLARGHGRTPCGAASYCFS